MARIIYDHEIFCMQKLGGVSRYICELASRVSERSGHSVKVVAPLHFNQLLAQSTVPRIGAYVAKRYTWTRRIYALASELTAQPLISLAQGDLVHQTYYRGAPVMKNLPVVVTVHDMIHELFPHYFPADDPTRARKRASVAAAEHIFCVSQSTASDLMQVLGVPPSKITVTHLGCSAIFSQTAPTVGLNTVTTDRPYLLYVGARGLYKNFSRFIEAFGSSSKVAEQVDIRIFGGGPITPAETTLFNKLGLRPNSVQWTTGDDAVLASQYANALAFVCPSEYEGFGIPLLESMNSRCPVLCSRGSSIAEVVGSAGEYFDSTSVESIRSALETVVFSKGRREALIAAGVIQASKFSWDKCTDETLKLYAKFN